MIGLQWCKNLACRPHEFSGMIMLSKRFLKSSSAFTPLLYGCCCGLFAALAFTSLALQIPKITSN